MNTTKSPYEHKSKRLDKKEAQYQHKKDTFIYQKKYKLVSRDGKLILVNEHLEKWRR